VKRAGEPATGTAQDDGRGIHERTPLRVEVAWASGYGLFCLAVAVPGFLWFLDRLLDL